MNWIAFLEYRNHMFTASYHAAIAFFEPLGFLQFSPSWKVSGSWVFKAVDDILLTNHPQKISVGGQMS